MSITNKHEIIQNAVNVVFACSFDYVKKVYLFFSDADMQYFKIIKAITLMPCPSAWTNLSF